MDNKYSEQDCDYQVIYTPMGDKAYDLIGSKGVWRVWDEDDVRRSPYANTFTATAVMEAMEEEAMEDEE